VSTYTGCRTNFSSKFKWFSDLDREEDTYYLLVNILRSPEMIKALTGTIDKVRDREIQEKERAMAKKLKVD